ncbi:MAG: hypothetical protein EAZ78_10055 [Oscillatoriales cyanobacterium]|nr:MAG: hypothetical protein EA000_20075 [Oscillatoriales cyanobacterium]TAE02996.1 MAG: hypothetical protein EAZ96_14300 [Oscillatoriales cyanobacterium]TAF04159.1 MAG: hypothetical protein EAZ78_10055 [Oscillatoriales cyanobacterium]TAF38362.1 MAG: hypothetical protein EAZ68_12900 [Oscillatoriales cyanobacterium]TAF63734.1 MAG: hypothetical protein EAZ59_20065 [Oscillatoriales cyanobacterium]
MATSVKWALRSLILSNHRASGIGHRASGIGHRASGMGNWASGIGHGDYLTQLDISIPESTPL